MCNTLSPATCHMPCTRVRTHPVPMPVLLLSVLEVHVWRGMRCYKGLALRDATWRGFRLIINNKMSHVHIACQQRRAVSTCTN